MAPVPLSILPLPSPVSYSVLSAEALPIINLSLPLSLPMPLALCPSLSPSLPMSPYASLTLPPERHVDVARQHRLQAYRAPPHKFPLQLIGGKR